MDWLLISTKVWHKSFEPPCLEYYAQDFLSPSTELIHHIHLQPQLWRTSCLRDQRHKSLSQEFQVLQQTCSDAYAREYLSWNQAFWLYLVVLSGSQFPGFQVKCMLLLQSCPTLCDTMDCSLLDFTVPRILQARILEWVAISFSRRSSRPRDRTCVSYVSYIGRRVLYH